jgi:hypothetical protein
MRSRLQGLRGGVSRGSKFGAIVGLIIWFIMACAGAILMAFIPEMRQEMLADFEGKSTLSMIGGFLAPVALMALYGAVPGAIIMGIAGVLRANRKATSDSN